MKTLKLKNLGFGKVRHEFGNCAGERHDGKTLWWMIFLLLLRGVKLVKKKRISGIRKVA